MVCIRQRERKRKREWECTHKACLHVKGKKGKEGECHFGVKLSLLRLAHSLINTDNKMFSAA